MSLRNVKSAFAALTIFGVVTASPAMAAGATRSVDALPLALPLMAQQSAGAVPYVDGMENRWGCVQVSNPALGVDAEFVRTDAEGRVVVDAQGAPFRCNPTGTANATPGGPGGLPLPLILGTVGAAGLGVALATSGGSDSPG